MKVASLFLNKQKILYYMTSNKSIIEMVSTLKANLTFLTVLTLELSLKNKV